MTVVVSSQFTITHGIVNSLIHNITHGIVDSLIRTLKCSYIESQKITTTESNLVIRQHSQNQTTLCHQDNTIIMFTLCPFTAAVVYHRGMSPNHFWHNVIVTLGGEAVTLKLLIHATCF